VVSFSRAEVVNSSRAPKGGSLLLRETDQRLNLLGRFSRCFLDRREQDRVEHSVLEMVAQRVYGLALGYEDVNDHEQLRKDPLFGVLARMSHRPLAKGRPSWHN
jgi:hypothetical protein